MERFEEDPLVAGRVADHQYASVAGTIALNRFVYASINARCFVDNVGMMSPYRLCDSSDSPKRLENHRNRRAQLDVCRDTIDCRLSSRTSLFGYFGLLTSKFSMRHSLCERIVRLLPRLSSDQARSSTNTPTLSTT